MRFPVLYFSFSYLFFCQDQERFHSYFYQAPAPIPPPVPSASAARSVSADTLAAVDAVIVSGMLTQHTPLGFCEARKCVLEQPPP